MSTAAFLRSIGVADLEPATSPFDPGYDPVTLEAHLEQSRHLISVLKISMACWLVADEGASRRKFAAAARHGVRTTTGGGPFEIAFVQGRLDAYLDLCADVGASRVECGTGFTDADPDPAEIVPKAAARGLEVQFELGRKHGGAITPEAIGGLLDDGRRWLDAGAVQLVVEARESASGVGVFGEHGELDSAIAERFVDTFGLEVVSFEAPNKASQFALLDHFGPRVHLCNVRLEELLRVEIYRRGIHSDAFSRAALRPRAPLGEPKRPDA